MDIYIYNNNHRVSVMEALELFWQKVRGRGTYTLEETRRIFDAAIIDHSTPHLKILQQFGFDVLMVIRPKP